MSNAHQAILDQYQVALDRRKNGGDEKSYTNHLYQAGLDKILKKCGEETFEVCIAAKNDDQAETVGELNDVLYHVTVLLCFSDVNLADALADVNRRCQSEGKTLDELMEVIVQRREENGEESYTAYLFREGLDKILKKVGEACSLLLIAGKAQDKAKIAEETGDLLFHLMAMMLCKGIPMDALEEELNRRSGKTGNLKTVHQSDHTT
jgi:phosphoribosyl-ATP pyrophosphohydrolase